MPGTTEKIREAEQVVARAKEALDTAEAGLRAAEKVSVAADEVRSHPVIVWLVVLTMLGLAGWFMMRRRSAAQEEAE